ncbi:DUF192 domain-containing protein [Brevundimonas sp.]|uniref:DUF192 domain-containing protein n=1 Tax=Brevundimonas sp. TaxID=1871086 RepID=UPI0025BCBF1B|nr:DUF192 domain-containing protein [Brevundimonas sp.]
MMVYRRIVLAGLAFAALAGAACAQNPPVDASGRPLEPLTIVTSTGQHKFMVEIADEEPERQRGLMYRDALAADRGMLFEWPGEPAEPRSFWMHNTPNPLDIVYVGEDGRIVSIVHNAAPNSDALLPSQGAAKGVVELRGGRAQEIGARAGDEVRHPYFAR